MNRTPLFESIVKPRPQYAISAMQNDPMGAFCINDCSH